MKRVFSILAWACLVPAILATPLLFIQKMDVYFPEETPTPASLGFDTGTQSPGPMKENTPMPVSTLPILAKVSAIRALNVRKGAGVSFPVLMTLDSGSIVFVIDPACLDEWIKVKTDTGMIGWVNSHYLFGELCP